MNHQSKKSRKDTAQIGNLILDEDEEETSKRSSSVHSSNASHMSEMLGPYLIGINKSQKLMLMKMMKKLFKILYQSPEITELRNKLKLIKQIKTYLVHVSKPSIQVQMLKINDSNFTCPVTKKVYDNILEMILFTVLSHSDVHVKAQIKDKGMLILYYEVGNHETFPSVKQEGFFNPPTITKSLSLFETKLKIFTQAKVARKMLKQSAELDRLVRRIGFTAEETIKLSKVEGTGFFAQKSNIGRPELFQYRLLRALIQNIFIFETLTCDTIPNLMPKYTRNLVSPLPKFKGLNFLKPENFTNGNLNYPTFKKIYQKFHDKFERIIQKNALFRSKPLGEPLKFEDVLVESEGEIDYELENNCVAHQLATNPNITIEEKLIICLYNRYYQRFLLAIDHCQQSALFCFYPGSVLNFPAQVCRACIDSLQDDPLLPYIPGILTILRLGDLISQGDFEELTAMCFI